MFRWLSFLISPELQHKLLSLKIFIFLLSLFFFVSAIYILRKSHYLNYRWRKGTWVKNYRVFKAVRPKKKSKEWNQIERLVKSTLLSEKKLAVVKAGDLLDKTLKAIGYPTGDWSERLSQAMAGQKFDLSSIIDAFQTREKILKNPDWEIAAGKMLETVEVLHKALIQLNYF